MDTLTKLVGVGLAVGTLSIVTHARAQSVARPYLERFAESQLAKPGTHTITLSVDRTLPRWSQRTFSPCTTGPGAEPKPALYAGWTQVQTPGDDPCYVVVNQVAVLFDTSRLDRIPDKVIDRAVLTYDESPATGGAAWAPAGSTGSEMSGWVSGGGARQDKPDGCVELRIPSVDWPTSAPEGLIPYLTGGGAPNVQRLGRGEWDVTQAFNWQYTKGAAPLGGAAGRGFLLASGPSLDDLRAEDKTSCMSKVENLRLQVTFTVPPDEPFRAPG